MSVAAAVVAVIGLGVSVKSQADASKARKEGQAIQSAAQLNEDVAARRRAAREERIRRAQVMQAAENTGAGGSSKEIGAISSISQQTAAGISRQSGQQATAQGLGQVNQNLADAQTTQAIGGAMQQISGLIFSETGGWESASDAFDNLFN